MLEIMTGEVPGPLVAQWLMALRARGERASEITGAVQALRSAMLRVAHQDAGQLVDTCGTGGGSVTTINVSTAAAFVAAGAGVPVAKHGNRSHTSRSGSADVLEALGISIDHSPAEAAVVLANAGMVFMFAPRYHPAMAHLAAVRRELGVPTLMNLVGPLANPAGVQRQVVGVADPARAPAVAEALRQLGVTHALVVHGEAGLDEISPVGATAVWEVQEGRVREWMFDPAGVGLRATSFAGLEGGTASENAARIVELFEGRARCGPALRHAILLNAAAAIYVGGVEATLAAAVGRAADALDSGAARDRLDALRASSPSPGQ